MKKYVLVVTGCLLLTTVPFWSAPGGAAEAPEGEVKVGGTVKASRPAGASELSIVLTTADGKVYNLVPDEKGLSLAKVMANVGEKTEIVGVPVPGKGADWLRVVDFTEPKLAAAHELWRHMRCNACVVKPATDNAAVPTDLRGATPVAGRPYDYKRRFTAWTRDDKFLWVAADNELLQFDLAGMKLVKSYGKAEGLPDQMIYQLISDGKRLWIVHRGGLAALALVDKDAGAIFAGQDKGRIQDLGVKGKFARLLAVGDEAWLVTDAQTVWAKGRLGYERESLEPEGCPPLPTAERIAKLVDDGIWTQHWERRTSHFITKPVMIARRLYVGSYGDIYELDLRAAKWTKLAEGGYEQCAQGGKLYFLSSKGLNEYDPKALKAEKTETLDPPKAVRGRYSRLVLTESAAWVVAEPLPGAGEAPPTGGGLARFDLAARKWDAWPKINDQAADQVACLAAEPGAVWAVTMEGKYSTKSAHPGMTTTKRQSFEATGFGLHRYDQKAAKWESLPLALAGLDTRLICGQDGCSGTDEIVPGYVEELSVGAKRIFALARLVPRQYFGGFWPCVEQVASRADAGAAWTAKFEHHPEELSLQGEQPLVLNISNGELTRIGSNLKDQLWEAIGHDLVLGLFFQNGKHWAVTEGCVACFDEAAGAWQKLAEPEYRWYWRATAALEDGKLLYLGSDRGLVCRLSTETGRFEAMTALKDRAVTRIVKGKDGEILVATKQAPLGALPVGLAGKLKFLEAEAARFDGKAWTAARPEDVPAAPAAPEWGFRQMEKKGMWDKSQGNFLCGPAPGEGEVKPRYYLKETFFPQFLCAGADGSRFWLSTYTGILRLDLPKPDGK